MKTGLTLIHDKRRTLKHGSYKYYINGEYHRLLNSIDMGDDEMYFKSLISLGAFIEAELDLMVEKHPFCNMTGSI